MSFLSLPDGQEPEPDRDRQENFKSYAKKRGLSWDFVAESRKIVVWVVLEYLFRKTELSRGFLTKMAEIIPIPKMEEKMELSNRQLLAISQIIASTTLEEARRKAKISKGTLYAWLRDDAFKAELKRQRDEVIKESLARLKSAITKAVEELIKLMDSSRPELRRLASKDILEYALKSIELEEIEERLDKVEQAISDRKGYR